MNKNIIYLSLATIQMAFIWLCSSRPLPLMPLPRHWDKLAHFAAWALLAVLLARGVRGRGGLWAPLAMAVVYGLVDEVHQSFVPGREMSALDLLADALGAAAGVGIAALGEKGGEARP